MASKEQNERLLQTVKEFVWKEFDMIPSVLFVRLQQGQKELNNVLELVDSHSRICSKCESVVATRGFTSQDGWDCTSCDLSSDDFDSDPYDQLEPKGPDTSWPGGSPICYWTSSQELAELAPHCGFLVYKSPDFNGFILTIDTIRINNIYNNHWVPLYIAAHFGVEKAYEHGFQK